MRAIIHSIHSQVPRTIASLNRRFATVVSFDSHLDVSLGGDDRIYPPKLRTIARRTGAHTSIRKVVGLRSPSGTRVIVAIPERMLAKHAEDTEANLPRSLRESDEEASIKSVVDFLRRERGIEVFQSPPESLFGLVRLTRRGSWLLDIDVDYMEEMRRECYTRIINPEHGVLQSKEHVLDFVLQARPEIITLSEAKTSAIRDPRSEFATFVEKLKVVGYKVEERGVAATDEDIARGISVCKEFYRTVSKILMVRHMDEMIEGDLDGFRQEERVAARAFFTSKGYAV